MDQHSSKSNFLVLVGLYHCIVALIVYLDKRYGKEDKGNIASKDLILLSFTAQRLSRLISKDKVALPIRAPFTQIQGAGLAGEIECKPRGNGMRRTIGTLLVCPYCLTVWIATVLVGIFRFFPRQVRLLANVFTAVTLADLLQVLYAKSKSSLEDNSPNAS